MQSEISNEIKQMLQDIQESRERTKQYLSQMKELQTQASKTIHRLRK